MNGLKNGCLVKNQFALAVRNEKGKEKREKREICSLLPGCRNFYSFTLIVINNERVGYA